MKKLPSLKAVISLTVICLVTAIALAVVNHITEPVIEQNELQRENEALRQVLPEGNDFGKPIDTQQYALDPAIISVYRETAGAGYVFKIAVNGYQSGMTILCGIGSDGKVDGALCLASSETLGYEKSYGNNFIDRSLSDVNDVDTVSGATMTTSAYRRAIELALDAFEKINK